MNVGDEASFVVRARSVWGDTELDLVKGASYEFTANGEWVDFFIRCDAAGYPGLRYQNWLRRSLRVPGAQWFALCGAVDRDLEKSFVIGSRLVYPAKSAGRLYCFANDVPGWYWNNWGSINVTAKRLA